MKMDWNVISILIGPLLIAITFINDFEQDLIVTFVAIGIFLFLYPLFHRFILTKGVRKIGWSKSEIKILAWNFGFFKI